MAAEFEKLAYEEALRALDKQEGLVGELRARTGLLLAASSIAASLLGPPAFLHPGSSSLSIFALGAIVMTLGMSVFVLLPKKGLVFAAAGPGIYEGLYGIRGDMADVYRHLVYDLQGFWESNEKEMLWLSRAFTFASGALVAEVLSLTALLGGRLL